MSKKPHIVTKSFRAWAILCNEDVSGDRLCQYGMNLQCVGFVVVHDVGVRRCLWAAATKRAYCSCTRLWKYEYREPRRIDTDRVDPNNSERSLSQWHFATRNPAWTEPVTNPGLRGESALRYFSALTICNLWQMFSLILYGVVFGHLLNIFFNFIKLYYLRA
jgi:hypothetical protein